MFFNALSSISSEFLAQPGEGPILPEASGGEPLHDFLLALLDHLPGQIMPAPPLQGLPEPNLGAAPEGELLPGGGKLLPLALLLGEGRLPQPPAATHDPHHVLDGEAHRALPPLSALPILLREARALIHDHMGAHKAGILPMETLLDASQAQLPARSPEIITAVPRLAHFEGLGSSPSTSPILTLSHSVATPDWSEALGNRVLWLANQRIQAAQIRLHPPHLGPLEVRVSVVDDTASVSFGVHNAFTRDALEAALPQLREMLAQQGLQLTDANVSHRGLGSEQQHRHGPGAFVEREADTNDLSPQHEMPRRRLGLVDDYA